MATGAANLIAFETTLDQMNITYAEMENAKPPALRIGYSLKNIKHLDVVFWFDDNGESMHYATGVIAHVPEDKTDVALRAINAANIKYRWLAFFLDNDNDIVSSGDQMLAPNVVGDTCYQLLCHTISICDEVYSTFMKALWS